MVTMRKQPVTFQDRLNVDVIRYILSFLNILDYENSKLYLKSEYRSLYLDKQIALLKVKRIALIKDIYCQLKTKLAWLIRLESIIPDETKWNIYGMIFKPLSRLLKGNEKIECLLSKKLFVQFEKKKRIRLRKMGFKFFLHKRDKNEYHLILWRKQNKN